MLFTTAPVGRGPATGMRAVCFDLDGTLYNQSLLRARVTWALFKAWMHSDITTKDLLLLRRYRQNRELARSWGEVAELEKRIQMLTAQQASVQLTTVAKDVERCIYSYPISILRSMRNRELREIFSYCAFVVTSSASYRITRCVTNSMPLACQCAYSMP
jgi:phosphoglycolate phosphatase-like HAD superfamily hydrolase